MTGPTKLFDLIEVFRLGVSSKELEVALLRDTNDGRRQFCKRGDRSRGPSIVYRARHNWEEPEWTNGKFVRRGEKFVERGRACRPT